MNNNHKKDNERKTHPHKSDSVKLEKDIVEACADYKEQKKKSG